MLNLVKASVRLTRATANCIAEGTATVDSDVAKITMPLPPKLASELHTLLNCEGRRILTMVNLRGNSEEAPAGVSGTCQRRAVENIM